MMTPWSTAGPAIIVFVLVWLAPAVMFAGLGVALARKWLLLVAMRWLVLGWPVASLTTLAVL